MSNAPSSDRLNQIQEELLDLCIQTLSWIALVFLALECVVALQLGWSPILYAGMGTSIMLILANTLRPKLGRSFKTALLLAPLWTISILLLLNFGLSGLGAMLLLSTHILAAFFMNRNHIWYFILASISTLVCVAFMVPKANANIQESWAWVALVMCLCLMTFMISRMDQMLRSQLKKLFDQIDLRYKRVRSIAKSELDKQKKDLHQRLLEAELLKQALRQLSLDSRLAVHDIMGLSHLLSQKTESLEMREWLMHISSNARQMRGMITQSSELALKPFFRHADTEFDLLKQARELVKAFEDKALSSGNELKLVIDPNIPAIVRGNGAMINNLLRSFFQVSLAHTLRGQILLQLSWEGEKDGKDLIRWTLRDNGFGLTRFQWQALWGELLDSEHLPSQPIAARIIQTAQKWTQEVGGTLEGKSEAGQGSEFQLSLPLAKPIARDQIWAEWILSLRGIPVLLIDDRPYSRHILNQYLDELGLEVHTATSHSEAIQLAYSGRPFKLIFVAVEIDGFAGFEISKQMRQIFEKNAGIILVTHSIEMEAEIHLQCEADGLMELPFGRTSLVAKVVDILRRYVPAPTRISASPPKNHTRGRVLVIGSHEIERWVLQEMLRTLGFDPHQARSNEEALPMLQSPEGWDWILHANDPSRADSEKFYSELKSSPYHQLRYIGILSEDDHRKNHVEFPYLCRPVQAQDIEQLIQSNNFLQSHHQ